ncbi:MAG TPA: hypothetical protein VK101_11240 [Limnochordia bacterium]|nr:hypothetical protein [Limnochordia bacterium]
MSRRFDYTCGWQHGWHPVQGATADLPWERREAFGVAEFLEAKSFLAAGVWLPAWRK